MVYLETTRARAAAGIVAGSLFAVLCVPASAQIFNRPQAPVPGNPSANPDASSVRIDRLERRVRTLTGEVEQLQHELRKLQKLLIKFQKDVDFRLREKNGGSTGRRGDTGGNTRTAGTGDEPHEPDPDASAPRRQAGNENGKGTGTGVGTGAGKGDAFDPSANPNAPGAPRQLGTAGTRLPSGPITLDGPAAGANRSGPLDLTGRRDRPRRLPSAGDNGGGRQASLPRASGPSAQYRQAVAALNDDRFLDAEKELKSFLQQYPKHYRRADANYFLGMAYEKQRRWREAAEQYLKVSTNYKKSARAPHSMYRLGLALEQLGAKEQACASYSEIGRKYPLAPGPLRQRAERQMRRAKC